MARMTANARREQVLTAAISEFARAGYFGASTQTIADRVELSQPYVFQLFGSKLQLFIAAWDVVCERIETVLRNAADGIPASERGHALASSYDALLKDDPDLLRMQLQAWAASTSDDSIREAVAGGFNKIWDSVGSLSSTPSDTVADMMGGWVLYNVAASLQIARIDECTVTAAFERAAVSGGGAVTAAELSL